MLACPRCRATYPDDVTACPDDGATLLPSEVLSTLDPPLEAGAMVGEYRIERLLGAGTFGEVYAAEQPIIGKRVAIKLLHRKLSSDAEVVSRFVAEARAVNRIRHKNIIDIFSFGITEDKRHYFVMELLDGLTLGELLDRERRLPIETALPILRGIAAGLDAAHEAGITHRDLKPDNVFLARERDGSYFPKLLDFGIAKLFGEEVAHRTATGIAMGTPRYMSPEQCRGKKVDHHADIYSLGVLVHEVLTGRPLFDAESAMDMLFLHTTEPPAPMSAVSQDLPSDLDKPVLAMLAKRPKDRPASAGDAIDALVRSARDHGTAATLPVSSVQGRSSEPAGASSGVPTVQVRKRSSSGGKAPHGGAGLEVKAATSQEGEAAGQSVPISFDADLEPVESADVSASGRTPLGTASTTGTLPGAPPQDALAGPTGATLRSADAGSARAAPAPARGPAFWAVVGLVVAAVIGGTFALARSGGPPAGPTASPENHPALSAPPAQETKVTPDPAPAQAPSTTPTGTPAQPTAATTGKPVARPKVPKELEAPP